MRDKSEYAEDDRLCPWCGGDLPGKPGQYVKCRHCGSDIVWRDGKVFKTKVQAAFPNPAVREVPGRFNKAFSKDACQTSEDFETGSMIIKFASSIFGDIWRAERDKSDNKRLRQRAVAAKRQLNALEQQKKYDEDSAKTRSGFGMIGLLYLSLVVVFVVTSSFASQLTNQDVAPWLLSVCGLPYFVFVIVASIAIVKQIFYSRNTPLSGGTRDFVIVMTVLALLPIFVISGSWCLAGGFSVYAYLSSYADSIKSSVKPPDAELFVPRIVKLELSGKNHSDKALVDANLSGANLSDKNLSDKNLSGANLSGADLSGANLSGAILFAANLTGADLTGADLTGADLTGAVLTQAVLAVVQSGEITGEPYALPMCWRLTNGYLIGNDADLSSANLAGATLTGANLANANLANANLTSANLTSANLIDANLARAKLMRTNLSGALLAGADLTSANLCGANLTDANLTGADLTSAILDEVHGIAKYNDATKLPLYFKPGQYGWIWEVERKLWDPQ